MQKSVAEWVERFAQMAGTPPTEIVLPGVTVTGPTYDSIVHDRAAGLEDGNTLGDWIQQAREVLGGDVKLWVNVIPSLWFMRSESLMVVNQYGARLHAYACITNPKVQYTLGVIVEELSQLGLHGVVFDFADIYPTGTGWSPRRLLGAGIPSRR